MEGEHTNSSKVFYNITLGPESIQGAGVSVTHAANGGGSKTVIIGVTIPGVFVLGSVIILIAVLLGKRKRNYPAPGTNDTENPPAGKMPNEVSREDIPLTHDIEPLSPVSDGLKQEDETAVDTRPEDNAEDPFSPQHGVTDEVPTESPPADLPDKEVPDAASNVGTDIAKKPRRKRELIREVLSDTQETMQTLNRENRDIDDGTECTKPLQHKDTASTSLPGASKKKRQRQLIGR